MLDTMKGLKRTHYCTQLSVENVGEIAIVAGWVQRQRDKGPLIFVDLRDRTGIVQLTFDKRTEKSIFEKAKSLRSEFVVMAQGEVIKRESVNSEIATGEIEILVTDLRILSVAQTPPFHISDDEVNEELRLKYRYLDLRGNRMQNAMITRHKVAKATRDYFDKNGFIEVETPVLIKSTPEGARDYLVPSRVHKGSFYALPQSPQLYKQLLMLSGYDRYMQIARCFRDEDLRADRQPEFTQIDLEMSFVDIDDVLEMNEGYVKYIFNEILDVDVQLPLKRMSYEEAMQRFGSDKPDTRFALELVDLSKELANTEFKVFAGALQAGGSVRAINVKDGASKLPRKKIDKLVDFVKTYGAKGLAFTRVTADAHTSSFEKFLSEDEVKAIHEKLDVQPNDVILVVADPSEQVVFDSLGALRCEVAKQLNLIDENKYDFLWVVDFPLFEYDEENDRYAAKHHPFTAITDEDREKLLTNPHDCKAKAYDLVLNGCEVGGGSIRINDPQLQADMFKALGFTEEQANEQFGFLMEAFKYGAPPHGGMAYGLDRLVMLMLKTEAIRDVIAFPKVQNASELMTQCPSIVDVKQLEELRIVLSE